MIFYSSLGIMGVNAEKILNSLFRIRCNMSVLKLICCKNIFFTVLKTYKETEASLRKAIIKHAVTRWDENCYLENLKLVKHAMQFATSIGVTFNFFYLFFSARKFDVSLMVREDFCPGESFFCGNFSKFTSRGSVLILYIIKLMFF